MGQKANPISLRLNLNRSFDSCWYSDTNLGYSKLLGKELQLRKYISSLFSSLGPNIQKGRISFQFYQKKLIIYYFFTDTSIKNLSSINRKKGGIRMNPSINQPNPVTSEKKSSEFFLDDPLVVESAHSDLESWDFKNQINNEDSAKKRKMILFLKFLLEKKLNENFYGSINRNYNGSSISSPPELSQIEAKKKLNFTLFPFLDSKKYFEFIFIYYFLKKERNLEKFSLKKWGLKNDSIFFRSINEKNEMLNSNLNKGGLKNLMFFPIKLNSKYLSAHFLSQYIAKCFEKRLSSREIFRTIQKEIGSNKNLVGLRIQCSGRIGGIEMAKVESKKFGQTSFHTFNTKLDFAISEAYTQYGIIGIQVSLWGAFSS
jgi:ribosomal protein S3